MRFNELRFFNGFASIPSYAFNSCANLTSVNLVGKTMLNTYAFQYCRNLAHIIGLEDVTYFGNYAMAYIDETDRRGFVLGKGAVTLMDGAFRYTDKTGMSLINLPLEYFIIRDGVASSLYIGNMAISGANLRLIDLPSNTGTIMQNMMNVGNMNSVPVAQRPSVNYVVRAVTPPTFNYTLGYVKYIFVPVDAVDSYKNTEKWSTYSSYIKPIGDTEWAEQFGSNNEWADYDLYGVPHD